MWYVLRRSYREHNCKQNILVNSNKHGARVDFFSNEENALKSVIQEVLETIIDIISCSESWDEKDFIKVESWQNSESNLSIQDMRDIMTFLHENINQESYDVKVGEIILS